MMPHCWKIALMDHDHADHGDVVTQEGEYIGTWSINEQGWYDFVADGDERSAITAAGVGRFCMMIGERLEAKRVTSMTLTRDD